MGQQMSLKCKKHQNGKRAHGKCLQIQMFFFYFQDVVVYKALFCSFIGCGKRTNCIISVIMRIFYFHQRHLSPSEVVQWSNHRVMEWLRVVDLAEYAPNLRGSGVHGGLIVSES